MSDDPSADWRFPGFQRWRELLFVHWEVPEEVLRAVVPRELEIDTFERRAYVGLIPFFMPEVRPVKGAPPVPTAASFLETNLRTYVRAGGTAGIWFFSLEAESTLAVMGARAGFGLPYFRARMAMERAGERVRYRSERRWPGPRPATLEAEYEVGEEIGTAAPGTLEHFLVERYVLFARHPVAGMLEARVRHQPYLLRRAKADRVQESLLTAAGIHRRGERTPDWFSEGVDVEIGLPRRLVTVNRGGLRPGIDLDRAARLIEEEDLAVGLTKMGR